MKVETVNDNQRGLKRVQTTSCAISVSGSCPATNPCRQRICWWTLRSTN